MVQYKNYHAVHVPPYPLDGEAARWVREVAEPRGYVNKALRKFADDQPFTRPVGTDGAALIVPAPLPATGRIRLLSRPAADATPPPSNGSRVIRIIKPDGR
jgi:hypothetical protein